MTFTYLNKGLIRLNWKIILLEHNVFRKGMSLTAWKKDVKITKSWVKQIVNWIDVRLKYYTLVNFYHPYILPENMKVLLMF